LSQLLKAEGTTGVLCVMMMNDAMHISTKKQGTAILSMKNELTRHSRVGTLMSDRAKPFHGAHVSLISWSQEAKAFGIVTLSICPQYSARGPSKGKHNLNRMGCFLLKA